MQDVDDKIDGACHLFETLHREPNVFALMNLFMIF